MLVARAAVVGSSSRLADIYGTKALVSECGRTAVEATPTWPPSHPYPSPSTRLGLSSTTRYRAMLSDRLLAAPDYDTIRDVSTSSSSSGVSATAPSPLRDR